MCITKVSHKIRRLLRHFQDSGSAKKVFNFRFPAYKPSFTDYHFGEPEMQRTPVYTGYDSSTQPSLLPKHA